MSLLQHCSRRTAAQLPLALAQTAALTRTVPSACRRSLHFHTSIAAAASPAAATSGAPVWPLPAAPAASSASIADGAQAIADSQAALAAAAIARARYHRRARLWLLAFITTASAVVTTYRWWQATTEQGKEISAVNAEIAKAKEKLAQTQQHQQSRDQAVRAALEKAAPGSMSVSAAVAPASFLTAAVLDVQRNLSLAPVDDRVLISANDKQNAAAATATPAAASKPAKPRQAIIM